MGGTITFREVQQAVKDLSAGKSPKGDGFPTEFYTSFSDLLFPSPPAVFKDALQTGNLPETMQNAMITLIHKKGKDPQQCGSYRPVSLVNVDAKILAKILASKTRGVSTRGGIGPRFSARYLSEPELALTEPDR